MNYMDLAQQAMIEALRAQQEAHVRAMQQQILQNLQGYSYPRIPGPFSQNLGGLDEQPPPPPSKLWEHPETITEEILAYRWWRLKVTIGVDRSVEVRLTSPYYTTIRWDGPTLRSPFLPAANSEHGLYALGVEDRHRNTWMRYMDHGRVVVWGQVALSGLVVEGERGYRAEVATIRELFLVHPPPMEYSAVDVQTEALIGWLGARYQCEVGVAPPEFGRAQQHHAASRATI